MFLNRPYATSSWARSLAQRPRPAAPQRQRSQEEIERQAVITGAKAIELAAKYDSTGALKVDAAFILDAARKFGLVDPVKPKKPHSFVDREGRPLVDPAALLICKMDSYRRGEEV